jgi:lipopolysaccharide transport system ATP-binding protein
LNDTVIKVEGIGKKYIISHEARENYTTLRDVIQKKSSSLFSPSKSIASSKEEFWALKDINFEVKRGEAIGIIGRNGAGKSTLLKILSRITEPTEGRIEINGRTSSLLEVGTGFHPELTGRENIFLNGAVLGMGRAEIKKKFDAIVDFSGVEKFLDTPVKRYSSGMYLRLAFAVAAFLEPEILMVDEVLAVGDAEFQKKCLGKMNEVSEKDGRTVLFVSHNLAVIQKLCKRGVYIKNGKIIFSGNIGNAISSYLDSGEASRAVYDIPKPVIAGETIGFAYRLTIEDINGNLINEIPVGAPWQVRVLFTLDQKVEHFIIGLGMGNSLNTAVRTTWSKEEDMEKGNYEVVFRELQLLFAAGTYQLAVGLSSFERTFHFVENAAVITIADVPGAAIDKSIIRTSGTGFILNPMNSIISPLTDVQ